MAQINKPTDYFNTVLYAGNGTTGHAITGVGFSPDFIWLKNRSATSSHVLANEVVGITSGFLNSDNANAENTTTIFDSVDADGITINSTGTGQNASGNNYALWNWYTGATPSSNTDGSITSSVSANTTSGFSIVSYTGNGNAASTVGHGLGAIPAMVIIKTRNTATYNWYVKHKSLASNNNVFLNLTNGTTDVSSQSQGGIGNLDNSSTFSFANGTAGIESVNKSSDTYIAYCFAEKKGFSKFGSYVGNNSSDGVFLYLGFKPSLFIVKKYSASGSDWLMYDNKRNEFNQLTKTLESNTSDAEATTSSRDIDFCSNGIKLRGASAAVNDTGSFIYMAFAENPLVGTNNIPATAR